MFASSKRSEDIKQRAQDFADSFLNVSNGTGVAAVVAKAEAKQIDPKDYVPNAQQMDKTTQRIYALFNTNSRLSRRSPTKTNRTLILTLRSSRY